MLLQNAANLVRRVLPPPPANIADLLVDAMKDLNSYGIVAWSSPASTSARARSTAVHDAGRMTVRTHLLYRAMRKDDVAKGVAYMKAQPNTEMLRFSGLKFPLDGGVEGGRMRWPYMLVPGEQTDPNYRGVLLLPMGGEDEYVEGLKLVAAAGLQAQTHAVGDETIDIIVRAYRRRERRRADPPAELGDHAPLPPLRRRAEVHGGDRHHGDDAEPPVLLGHNQRRWWGDERAAYAIPIRKAIDAGVLVGGGTDGPVVAVDPFLSDVVDDDAAGAEGICARRRARHHGEGGAPALHDQQRADHGRREGPGQHRGRKARRPRRALADILAVPADRIRDTRALMTVLGGRIVYRNGL